MKYKFVGTILFSAAFAVFSSYTFKPTADKESVLIQLMQQVLNYNHYQPQKIDNLFSQEVFDIYLEKLDNGKRYLTQVDVERLSKFRSKIDDEALAGEYSFFDLSVEIYKQRTMEAEAYYQEILASPFDFTKEEEFDTDFENKAYPRDKAALKESWRKLLKYQTLTRLDNMIERQEEKKESGDEDLEELSFDQMEAKAREKVQELWSDAFQRINKINTNDLRELYINSIANRFDPHTGYFPPKEKEEFDIRMSGSYEGIGARLTDRDGKISVTEILPGSPCYRLGVLEVGDEILKVAQGEGEPVDIVDMRVEDAVVLIRGEKDTEVRLTVKKIGGNVEIIPIVRGQVKLEETYAKSAVLNLEDGDESIGYIHLPKFYADFENPAGRQCADDVAAEIAKLKSENVSGIILDLRNNGGGSLSDVVEMSGLFIEKGPIVQVKSRQSRPYVLRDKDESVQWNGPLVVMVNSLSASASEILAAAIQDYGRGIIIGSNSTFGKGTVQRFVDLDQFITDDQGIKPLGAMKLTIQKFYRINGDATQIKGVIPDIVLPDNYSYIDLGEKDQDFPMKWDEISPVSYSKWKNTMTPFEEVIEKSTSRISEDPNFQLIDKNAQELKTQREDRVYSLNLQNYQIEQEKLEKKAEEFENQFNETFAFKAIAVESSTEMDEAQLKNQQAWIKGISKDPYIFESLKVALDMK